LINIVHKRKTMIVEYINSRSRHAEFDESLTGIGVYNMFDALYLSLLEVKKHGGYAGYRPNVVILFGGKFEKLYKTSDDEEGHHILTTQLAPWMSMVMHVNRVAAAGCDVRIVLTGRGGYSDKAVEEYASELMKCSGMKQKGVELVRKKEQPPRIRMTRMRKRSSVDGNASYFRAFPYRLLYYSAIKGKKMKVRSERYTCL